MTEVFTARELQIIERAMLAFKASVLKDEELARIEAQRMVALASISPRHNGDTVKTIEEIIRKASKYVERI